MKALVKGKTFNFIDGINEYNLSVDNILKLPDSILFPNFTNEIKVINFEENSLVLMLRAKIIAADKGIVKSITIYKDSCINLLKSHDNIYLISDTIGDIKIEYYNTSEITEIPLMQGEDKFEILTNRTIKNVYINDEELKDHFVLKTEIGLIEIKADSDSYNESWFEHTENIDLLKGSIIICCEFVQINNNKQSNKIYNFKIHHTKGVTTFEMRNNGKDSYGGYIDVNFLFMGIASYKEITDDF